jgi:hypothetical protein
MLCNYCSAALHSFACLVVFHFIFGFSLVYIFVSRLRADFVQLVGLFVSVVLARVSVCT